MEFSDEIIDNLDLLETALLGTAREGESTSTLSVGIIFRYAHNTKGLLAMAGEEACRDAIHELETTLDLIRNGKGFLSAKFRSLALDLISALRAAANQEMSEHDLIVIASQIKDLRDEEQRSFVPNKRPFPNILGSGDISPQLQSAKDKQHHLYLIEKIISAEISDAEWRLLPIFEAIPSFGLLVWARALDTAAADGTKTLQLIFTSALTSEEIEFCVFDPHYEIEYPLAPAARVLDSRPTKLKPTPRVLIVDDEGTSRRVLQRFLNQSFDCEVTCNGQEGLFSFMLALEEGAPFELVCLDVSMPVIDGAKMLGLLRRMEQERGVDGKDQCPVLMITAERSPRLIASSFFASCDGFLHKPLDINQLKHALAELGFA